MLRSSCSLSVFQNSIFITSVFISLIVSFFVIIVVSIILSSILVLTLHLISLDFVQYLLQVKSYGIWGGLELGTGDWVDLLQEFEFTSNHATVTVRSVVSVKTFTFWITWLHIGLYVQFVMLETPFPMLLNLWLKKNNGQWHLKKRIVSKLSPLDVKS